MLKAHEQGELRVSLPCAEGKDQCLRGAHLIAEAHLDAAAAQHLKQLRPKGAHHFKRCQVEGHLDACLPLRILVSFSLSSLLFEMNPICTFSSYPNVLFA